MICGIDKTKSARQGYSLLALTVFLVALSLAVINWGLQYKMSLYQGKNGSAHAPAKLWTGKTSTVTAAVEIEQQASVAAVLTSLPVLLLFPHPEVINWPRLATPRLLQVGAALTAFFFRPPPVFA